MRNSKLQAQSLLAMASVLAAGAGMARDMPAWRPAGGGHRRTPPKLDTALQREIAAHNEAVERRKAEKKAAKLARRSSQPDRAEGA